MPLCNAPHILLVNPWIHDFAAYDFWAKPMGLLIIASMLRHHGIQVSYIDCLDRFHPRGPKTDPGARYGRGPFYKTRIPKPAGLHDVPRYFSRYGIKPQWFREDLLKQGRPDLIMVTSLMTYWYPGVQETIQAIKTVFPRTPIVLGGIYARLCTDHAQKNAGADHVVDESGQEDVLSLVRQFTGYSATPAFDPEHLDDAPYPALDLQTRLNYVPLLTSRGCPFHCAYCASRFLEPKRLLRDPQAVVEEIAYWKKSYGLCDFVLYDDAFLMDADRHAIPILEGILQTGIQVRFHTPNAVHIRGINPQTARLMFDAGFTTLRLGLETAEFNHREEIDAKVSEHEFKRAVNCLREAGFKKNQIGAYLLVGLPGQNEDSIKHSIDMVKQIGITPVAAYYTPIPHTALWPKAVAASRYDLESDPIFSNNAVIPCQKKPFNWEMIRFLKALIAA
jgi:radical SAM superfamily enzyme YgiQ (UPF0313 family)